MSTTHAAGGYVSCTQGSGDPCPLPSVNVDRGFHRTWCRPADRLRHRRADRTSRRRRGYSGRARTAGHDAFAAWRPWHGGMRDTGRRRSPASALQGPSRATSSWRVACQLVRVRRPAGFDSASAKLVGSA